LKNEEKTASTATATTTTAITTITTKTTTTTITTKTTTTNVNFTLGNERLFFTFFILVKKLYFDVVLRS